MTGAMPLIKAKSKFTFKVRHIRKNPYWQKPYLLRVWLHWTGQAPYQNRKGVNHNG